MQTSNSVMIKTTAPIFLFLLVNLILFSFAGCGKGGVVYHRIVAKKIAAATPAPNDSAPVTSTITPGSFDANSPQTITLSYTDTESHLATACAVSNLTNITESTACFCNGSGVCTVGITGTLDYAGSASFNYTVTANGLISNSSSATLTIDNISTFYGWTNVKALGTKSAIALTGAAAVPAYVELKFSAMDVVSGLVGTYNVYRDTSPNIVVTKSTTPYAEGVDPATTTYTDSTVTSGTTYYYRVAPVVNGIVAVPDDIYSDQEIKVIVAPPNMALVHRWIANREMCMLMGKMAQIDRDNYYRCPHAGPGGDGTYFDMGGPLLVDAFKLGCNYSETACAGSYCLGTIATPSGVVAAAENSVYYSRANGRCFINNSSGTGNSWITDATSTITSAQRALMASNKPGLPPLVVIDQEDSNSTCASMSESGFAGNKRLLSRKEWVVAAAWDEQLSDAEISSIEDGIAATDCNTDSGSMGLHMITMLCPLSKRRYQEHLVVDLIFEV
ncbi:MAG: hypothetical protein A2504_16540 [Bdellovibrionales bacterium RIFOXYD12_FULL_39_22]|nr:MAG: hypothetical protein A2385_12820 [Bdellovibrionales bacterium RIFOXYB1_FULL_39_21]OFZ44984.1 MAG: hypothetical protein A2404_14105 [Bdellovibrionales bacterium RIFOXYC1_FULL_39_130]OFZ74326.1 MAG: hypothetical protein A2560_17320 [Bdellovibrionales bacterium RIFOXYD1_FULL_39_84]OFZ94073.1 MAG: hypothetical protein A2504_16540 [Bdellovibrionales bacterium RIFOXYD12_FULL_39_22]